MENIIATLTANHFSWFPRCASGEDGLGELAGAGEHRVHEVKAVGTKMSKQGKVAAGVPVRVKRNGRRYFSNPGIG